MKPKEEKQPDFAGCCGAVAGWEWQIGAQIANGRP